MSHMTHEEAKTLLPQALQPHIPFTWPSYRAFVRRYSADDRTYERDRWHRDEFTRDHAQQLVYPLFFEWPQIYRSKLPVYLLARCPICGGGVYEAVDTGSLSGVGWWDNEPRGVGWFGPRHEGMGDRIHEVSYTAQCSHIQAVTYGINLNGILPNEPDKGRFLMMGSEEPGIYPPLVSDPEGYVVIRTLPVGRVDDEVWQPRYTAYFMSYFSGQAGAGELFKQVFGTRVYKSHLAGEFAWPYEAESYDLEDWVESGRLQWLEPEPPHALRRGSWSEYPYGHLTGLRGRWIMTDGNIYTTWDWKRHMSNAAKEVWQAALAKRNLRNIKPKE